MPAKSNRVIVSVIGADTVGISAQVAAVVAMRASTSSTARNAKGGQIGLKIDARHEDAFKFTHRL